MAQTHGDIKPLKRPPNTRVSPKVSQGVDPGTTLRKPESPAITDIRTLRNLLTRRQQLEVLAKDDVHGSMAVFGAVALATKNMKLEARDNATGRYSVEATQAVHALRSRMDTIHDYSKGFSDKTGMISLISQLILDAKLMGGVACELVFDKNRMPSEIVPIRYASLQYKVGSNGKSYPMQRNAQGEEVDLDYANIFVAELPKVGADDVYPLSMLNPGIKPAIGLEGFIANMRAATHKTGHSRLIVTLDVDKVRSYAPAEVQQDPNLLAGFLESFRRTKAETLSGLQPDQAVVDYDYAKMSVEDIGHSKSDYVPLLEATANMSSASMKTPAPIIGLRTSGSQSMNNVEVLVYLRYLELLRNLPVEVLSRAFTLAVRQLGYDAHCVVKFDTINLRPEDELQAYFTMRQTAELELLSLGKITDAQFCNRMGIAYDPDAPKLSGTGFALNNQGNLTQLDNSEGVQRQLNPDTPKNAGGKDQ